MGYVLFRPSFLLVITLLFLWGMGALFRPALSAAIPKEDAARAPAGYVPVEDARMLTEVAQQLVAQIENDAIENRRNEKEWITSIMDVFSDKGSVPELLERFELAVEVESRNEQLDGGGSS